jgi:heptose-I-phosphate ethanolaminephosphotransferase
VDPHSPGYPASAQPHPRGGLAAGVAAGPAVLQTAVTQQRTFAEAREGRTAHGAGGALAVGGLPAISPAARQHAGLLQKNAALPPLQNLADSNGDTPRTLVLVLGESTTREHMHLYGYNRDTTPNLDALAASDKGLTVFRNVVSPRPTPSK